MLEQHFEIQPSGTVISADILDGVSKLTDASYAVQSILSMVWDAFQIDLDEQDYWDLLQGNWVQSDTHMHGFRLTCDGTFIPLGILAEILTLDGRECALEVICYAIKRKFPGFDFDRALIESIVKNFGRKAFAPATPKLEEHDYRSITSTSRSNIGVSSSETHNRMVTLPAFPASRNIPPVKQLPAFGPAKGFRSFSDNVCELDQSSPILTHSDSKSLSLTAPVSPSSPTHEFILFGDEENEQDQHIAALNRLSPQLSSVACQRPSQVESRAMDEWILFGDDSHEEGDTHVQALNTQAPCPSPPAPSRPLHVDSRSMSDWVVFGDEEDENIDPRFHKLNKDAPHPFSFTVSTVTSLAFVGVTRI